jgi:hypothetical protein
MSFDLVAYAALLVAAVVVVVGTGAAGWLIVSAGTDRGRVGWTWALALLLNVCAAMLTLRTGSWVPVSLGLLATALAVKAAGPRTPALVAAGAIGAAAPLALLATGYVVMLVLFNSTV